MRAETLHRIVDDIWRDIEITGAETYLPRLIERLQEQINDPSQATQQKVVEARDELLDGLDKSVFNSASPSDQEILKSMVITLLLGNGLAREVRTAFEGNEVTAAPALTRLKELNEAMQKLYRTATSFVEGMEYFEIEPDVLDPGEFEVMIQIPGRAIDDELEQFGKETLKLNQILGVFSEMATGSREPLRLGAVGSTDPTLYVATAAGTAVAVAVALDKIAALYERILNIIKLHRQMKAIDLPAEVLAPLKKHIDKTVKDGVERIAKQLEREHFSRVEEARKQELKTELRIALREIASRMDRGYSFDVRGEPAAEPDAEEGTKEAPNSIAARAAIAEAAKIVEEVRPRLKHFQAELDPILGLSDGTAAS